MLPLRCYVTPDITVAVTDHTPLPPMPLYSFAAAFSIFCRYALDIALRYTESDAFERYERCYYLMRVILVC